MDKRETLFYGSIGVWLVAASVMMVAVAYGHDLEAEVVLVVIGALSTVTVCLLVTMLADRLRCQIGDLEATVGRIADRHRVDDTVPIPRVRATAAVGTSAQVLQLGARIAARITDD